MMRRLMLLLADKEEEDLEEGFTEEIQSVENEANNDYTLREESILIKKSLRDSWLLVRIALDRGGFSVEDRDFIEGVFYIQHSGGPESNKIFGENKGEFWINFSATSRWFYAILNSACTKIQKTPNKPSSRSPTPRRQGSTNARTNGDYFATVDGKPAVGARAFLLLGKRFTRQRLCCGKASHYAYDRLRLFVDRHKTTACQKSVITGRH